MNPQQSADSQRLHAPPAAASQDPAVPARRSLRRYGFLVHSWVGLKLSLLMAVILATGTLAVFSHEIDWLLQPDLRAAPTASTDFPWPAVADRMAADYPELRMAGMTAPVEQGFALRILARDGDGRFRWVYADPSTGEIQGDAGLFNAQRLLRFLHRHLMLPTTIGVPLVSSFSLLLLASLVTSFVIYKGWWRGFFRAPRSGRPRRFWGDLHRLLGVWSIAFLVIMIATGFWYLVESLGGDAPSMADFPASSEAPPPPHWRGEQVEQWLETARQAYPDLRIRAIWLPARAGEAVELEGQATAILVRDRANAVLIDPANGSLLGTRSGESLNLHQRISEMADPLHFGTFAGLASKIAYFIFGLALTALALSGAWIYGLRISRSAALAENRYAAPAPPAEGERTHSLARRKPVRKHRPSPRHPARALFVGMGWWRWPSLVILMISLILIPLTCVRI